MDIVLKNKINEAMKERFVGNYLFAEEELSVIFDNAGKELRALEDDRGSNLSLLQYDLVFVAVVYAAKSWMPNEETFFETIFEKLIGKPANGKIYNQITQMIDRLSAQHKIFAFEGHGKRYYATICAHAFMPKLSMDAFFDLCWEIFSNDIGYQYCANDEIFGVLADSLAKNLSSAINDAELLNLGSKAYSLRIGIKRLALEKKAYLVELIDNVICMMNQVINQQISISDSNCIRKLFNNWWEHKQKETPKSAKKYERTVFDHSKINAKYIYEDQVVIRIPAIALKENFYYFPILQVYNDQQLLYSKDMRTFGSGLMMATCALDLNVKQLVGANGDLSKITITISHCDTVIYDSNKTLYRDFIVFKNGREVRGNSLDVGNYKIWLPSAEDLHISPECFQYIDSDVYDIYGEEGDKLQYKRSVIFFGSTELSHDAYFVSGASNKYHYLSEGKSYHISQKQLLVCVKSVDTDKRYGVELNGNKNNLDLFKHALYEGNIYYNISKLAPKDRKCTIRLFNYSNNDVVDQISLIRLEEVSCDFDQPYYYYGDDSCGKLSYVLGQQQGESNFHLDEQVVHIPLYEGEVIVPIPTIRWKIGESQWNTGIVPIQWKEKIGNNTMLYIDSPHNVNFTVCLNNDLVLQHNGKNEYNLGEAVHGYSKGDELAVRLRMQDDNILPIVTYALVEKFVVPPMLLIDDNVIYWSAENSYVGKDGAMFLIELLDKDKAIYSMQVGMEDMLEIDDIEQGIYNVRLSIIGDNIFAENKEVFTKQIVHGDINALKFKDKHIVINHAVRFDGRIWDIKPIYIDNLQFILQDEDGSKYYQGDLYILIANHNKKYLTEMPAGNGTNVVINPVRVEIRSSRSCWIVAGLQPGVDIYNFEGDFFIDRQKQLTMIEVGTIGIDYYQMEVVDNV